jgi:O-methyltransferase
MKTGTRMVKLAKRGILRFLNYLGYCVIKKKDYDALLVTTSQPVSSPVTTVSPDANPVVSASAAPTVSRLPIVPPPLDSALFSTVLQRIATRDTFTMGRLHALYSTVKRVVDHGIDGDFVDCGWGDATTLIALAASLLQLEQLGRRLVLFDTSVSPLHSVEFDLQPWGADYELLRNPPAARSRRPEPLLPELIASGYPTERIIVRRYPREPIAHDAPIAFLHITSEGYDANRKALEVFFSCLSPGGILAIEDIDPQDDGAVFVTKFLRRTGPTTSLYHASSNFRIFIKSQNSSQ